MLVAEELALLFYNDQGAPLIDGTSLDSMLAGAILVELAVTGQLRITGPGEPGVRGGRVLVNPDANPNDPILAETLRLLRERGGLDQKAVVGILLEPSTGLRRQLLDRLTRAGILRYQAWKTPGNTTLDRWPPADPATKRAIGARLHDVLIAGREPDARTTALIAILAVTNRITPQLDHSGFTERRRAKRRAKRIADGEWTGKTALRVIRKRRGTGWIPDFGGAGFPRRFGGFRGEFAAETPKRSRIHDHFARAGEVRKPRRPSRRPRSCWWPRRSG